MILLPTFDPTNPSSGQFNLNLTGGYGKVVIYNESNSNLKLTFSNNYSDYLPAWTAIELCFLDIPLTNPLVQYSTLSVLANIVATPISQVAIVIYEASEHVGGTYPAPLVRSLSIGNQVNSTSTTNQVTNDGNPTVTTFIESTQQGNASGSNIAIGNDGSYLYAQFVSSTYNMLEQLVPGASPVLKWGKGLVLQALDNSGANLSNILGIDSSGNTFLQNHKTNNQTVIYDKNGVALLTVQATGGINIAGTSQSVNGDTSGTMTTYEAITGSSLKILQIAQNNYKQAGATGNSITLKNAFTTFFSMFGWGVGGVNFRSAGSSQNLVLGNGALALGGAAIGNSTQYQGVNIGGFFGACDTIRDNGSYAGAHTGVILVFGI